MMPDPTDTPIDAPPDLSGRTVGDFQVLRKLGQGGMGQVYLARQLSLKREVALKILSRHLAADPTALKRFQAEAEAVARVTHANIVQVYAIGEQDDVRYMALEYVQGRNLRDYLARKGPPELPVAIAIMRQIAAALQRASEIGIVHRDIKPENILVTRKAEVKVADFGLSRYFATEGQPLSLTQSGVTLGTPLYMSPEQVQGHTVDHRSDVYSFGVTCYHLLAGHPPFQGATPFEVAVQHVQNEPAPLTAIRSDLPAELCAVIHRMMAKRPEDRYQTAREVARDLVRIQKGLPVDVPTGAVGAATMTSLPAGPVLSLSSSGQTMYVPIPVVPQSGARRGLRVLGVIALVGVAIGGWWLFTRVYPRPEPKIASVGLPEARLPEPVISIRERELKATLQNRSSKPDEVFNAAVALGVLYVRERRLDEADRVFKELEQERIERLGGAKGPNTPTVVAGRLGHAVVLAYRDQAAESIHAFSLAVPGAGRPAQQRLLESFLLAHPQFGQAVAEAINRDAENYAGKKLPERLEWLRTPGGFARGSKGG